MPSLPIHLHWHIRDTAKHRKWLKESPPPPLQKTILRTTRTCIHYQWQGSIVHVYMYRACLEPGIEFLHPCRWSTLHECRLNIIDHRISYSAIRNEGISRSHRSCPGVNPSHGWSCRLYCILRSLLTRMSRTFILLHPSSPLQTHQHNNTMRPK
jgi:hypothetical protein